MNQLSKSSFSLNEAVGDVELFAEVGQPDDKFNRVDVVGNSDEFGLLLFDKFGDMVQSKLKMIWFAFGDFFLWVRN